MYPVPLNINICARRYEGATRFEEIVPRQDGGKDGEDGEDVVCAEWKCIVVRA